MLELSIKQQWQRAMPCDGDAKMQYMPGVDDSPEAVEAQQQKWRRRRWGSRPTRQEAEAGASERAAAAAAARGRAAAAEGLGAYWESLAQNSWVTSSEEEQLPSDSEERRPAADEQRQHMDSSGSGNGGGNSSPKSATGAGVGGDAAAAAVSPGGWPLVTPDDLAAALRSKSAVVLDVRTARDWEWGKIKGAAHCPFIESKGSSLSPTIERNPRFLDHAKSKAPDKGRHVIVYGPGRAQTAEEGAVFVSKELFVSLAPGAAGGEEWQVRGRGLLGDLNAWVCR
jgi:rhodanese-related sulfurtransferase